MLYKINTQHLKYKALLEKQKALWEELKMEVLMDLSLATDRFLKGITHSKKITRTYGKAKSKSKRLREVTLHGALATTQINLEGAP